MTDNFYRYIYRENNGYSIKKNGEHYGYYTDLREALYDRDRLEQVDWDIQTWTELPVMPNHYKAITLPSFKRDTGYITHIPERWVVQRKINGKIKYFGRYKSLEEARKRRDELILNGWCDE